MSAFKSIILQEYCCLYSVCTTCSHTWLPWSVATILDAPRSAGKEASLLTRRRHSCLLLPEYLLRQLSSRWSVSDVWSSFFTIVGLCTIFTLFRCWAGSYRTMSIIACFSQDLTCIITIYATQLLLSSFPTKVVSPNFSQDLSAKIGLLWSNQVVLYQLCSAFGPCSMCHSFRKCMQSIHFLHFSRSFWLAEKAEEAMLPTVKGIPYRRHACAQFCAPPGLIKLIKTSLVRASAWALANSRAGKG